MRGGGPSAGGVSLYREVEAYFALGVIALTYMR
jgi:hypothetical protein